MTRLKMTHQPAICYHKKTHLKEIHRKVDNKGVRRDVPRKYYPKENWCSYVNNKQNRVQSKKTS